jgi:hypothetical protein
MSERIPIYDAGMLIALADRKAKAVTLHASVGFTAHRAVILGLVLAQVWRPHSATVHTLGRVLKDCTIPQARTSAPALRRTGAGQITCLTCATAPDLTDWQRIGSALGIADLPPKKRPDAVDALVALTAAQHGSAVIFTSNPGDLQAYLTSLNARDVHLVEV